jgi:hypothetical protein
MEPKRLERDHPVIGEEVPVPSSSGRSICNRNVKDGVLAPDLGLGRAQTWDLVRTR